MCSSRAGCFCHRGRATGNVITLECHVGDEHKVTEADAQPQFHRLVWSAARCWDHHTTHDRPWTAPKAAPTIGRLPLAAPRPGPPTL